MSHDTTEELFETLTGGAEDDVGLSEEAEAVEPANGLRHVVALSMTKVADGLIDPKLILTWLMNNLGAPGYLIAMLVPIREAGALLPQIVLAGVVQRMAQRKWIWVVGSAGQGVCAALIVLSGFLLEGVAAGLAICASLGGLALFRAACSVSFKDILGKTVAKTRRGAITGTAGSVAAAGVLLLALLLISGGIQNKALVLAAIGLAALLWGGAALVMSMLREMDSETGGDKGRVDFSLLRDNPQLWRFILVRGLLVSTALAPPYIVLLDQQGGLQQLGALVLASSLASFLSSYLWGRLSDASSRKVLMRSGIIGAVAMAAAVVVSLMDLAGIVAVLPACLMVLMIAYNGVRQGRSTYLVDMAPEDQRSAYAAVSNTVIGCILLLVGLGGGVASIFGPKLALAGFAIMALAATWVARGLDEVEKQD